MLTHCYGCHCFVSPFVLTFARSYLGFHYAIFRTYIHIVYRNDRNDRNDGVFFFFFLFFYDESVSSNIQNKKKMVREKSRSATITKRSPSQTPRGRETDKSKQAQIEQTYEKH